MDAIVTWLEMSGYAAFVWAAYGIATAILGGLALHAWRRHRLSATALDSLERRPRE